MNVYVKGIKSLLKDECVDCNLHIRREENNICSDCNFRFNSTRATGRRGVCPGSIFKKYGLKNPGSMGKHTLYYFLYYPELNFEFPPLPDEDLFGKTSSEKTFVWHIHHMNIEYWNDHIWNLLLCLNTEHRIFESVYWRS
jgi:hypothetical protein